jgi:hypothetical protein
MSNLDLLRTEILDAAKAAHELLKWKLALVAGLGSAGLGVIGKDSEPIVLIFIPFVCLYADTASNHQDLRVSSVAHYLREAGPDNEWRHYELYCSKGRGRFSLESVNLIWSTVALSLAVAYVGLFRQCSSMTTPVRAALLASGIVGASLAIFLQTAHEQRLHELETRRDLRSVGAFAALSLAVLPTLVFGACGALHQSLGELAIFSPNPGPWASVVIDFGILASVLFIGIAGSIRFGWRVKREPKSGPKDSSGMTVTA